MYVGRLTMFVFLIIISMQFMPTFTDINNINANEMADVIYLSYSETRSNAPDPICELEKGLKIALCDRIFKSIFYIEDLTYSKLFQSNLPDTTDLDESRIHINKPAFSISSLECELKSLDFGDVVKEQPMYPCYGQHNPIRTNFLLDDYFDKYSVSAGKENDSVFVYLHEFDLNSDSDEYNVYDYIENVQIKTLTPIDISPKMVTSELMSENVIRLTDDMSNVENIYILEVLPNSVEIKDTICDLEDKLKIALCDAVFNLHYYKNLVCVTTNELAFYVYDTRCEELAIKFNFNEKYNNPPIKQKMLPCYGKHIGTTDNVLEDIYLKKYYISDGARPNSVIIYNRVQGNNGERFAMEEFIENLKIKYLKPQNLDISKILSPESLGSSSIIEDVYVGMYKKDQSLEDPICDIPKDKKIALCQEIFNEVMFTYEFRATGILINKVAFAIATAECEIKELTFNMRKTYNFKNVKQVMFPCYGRNNPVRSNFIQDDYFKKVFISSGYRPGSIFVYIMERDSVFSWYNLFDFIHYIDIRPLSSIFIHPKEVTDELEMNDEIISTRDLKEIQDTFLREIYHHPDPELDLVCVLNKKERIALCELLLNQPYYKDTLKMTINYAAFYYYEGPCERNNVKFYGYDPQKTLAVSHEMIPCYGKHMNVTGDLLMDSYVKHFSISGGSRPNSLFVFLFRGDAYSVDDFLENLDLTYLDPKEVTIDDVKKEAEFAVKNRKGSKGKSESSKSNP